MWRKNVLNVCMSCKYQRWRIELLARAVQFCDANLRRFNLIAVDMRGYGETIGTIGDAQFTPSESAADVDQIMVCSQLPSIDLVVHDSFPDPYCRANWTFRHATYSVWPMGVQ